MTMKHIKRFDESYDKKMSGGSDSDNKTKNVYAFFTKELLDRKSKQKHSSYVHDAYHIRYNSEKELEELKNKYSIGSKYKNETIVSYTLLDSKTLEQ